MRVSYCIPTHDHPRCEQYMFDVLYPLAHQTSNDFEICVSHQGDDKRILKAFLPFEIYYMAAAVDDHG